MPQIKSPKRSPLVRSILFLLAAYIVLFAFLTVAAPNFLSLLNLMNILRQASMIAIIGLGGGFIPAMTVLFAATATAFGRRAILADLAIGFVIGTIIYIAFSRLLTLSLPAGPIERLF